MFLNRLAKEKWDELNAAIDAAPVVVPCSNTDPEIWFNDYNAFETYGYQKNTKIARKLCDACPVKNQCLEYSLVNREEFGMWGGLTARERADLLRSKRRSR